VLCLNRDQRHFAWVQDAGLFAGQDGVVVLQQYREQNQKPQEIARYFSNLRWLGEVMVHEGAQPAIPLQLYWGSNFTPQP
jgi:hypothetical protein